MTRRWLFIVTLLLLLSYPHNAESAKAALSQARSPSLVGWVVAKQGRVKLFPRGKRQHAKAAQLCMKFELGDLLSVAPGGQATIVCTDLKEYPLSPGVHGLPCRPSGRDVLSFQNSQVIPTRSDVENAGFPQILAPRKTKLLTPYPLLRWTSVAGIDSYQISLMNKGNVTWSMTVNATTELRYPTTAPALEFGETYKLVVAADKRSSEEEELPGLGFSVLNDMDAQRVHQAEAEIRKLGLPNASIRFLLSRLYAASGLHSEAIEQLSGLHSVASEAAVTQQLGDLYRLIGLNRQAEGQYVQTLKLMRLSNDLSGQVRVQIDLGQLYEAFGNKKEAERYWLQAKQLCSQIGDKQKANQIQTALAKLMQ